MGEPLMLSMFSSFRGSLICVSASSDWTGAGNVGALRGRDGLKLDVEGTRVVAGGFSGDVGREGAGRGL